MRAARWHERGSMAVEEVPVPTPAADEALVAVDWVGICGSDVEEFVAGPVQISPPVTLGHEIVGTVTSPAADGSGPPAGTRVVVDVVTGCGGCYWCLRHEEGLCPDLVVTGQHRDGGLADYVVARADRLTPVPDGLSSRDAVFAEPLAVAVRAVRKAGPVQGASVVVVGGGTIGMLVAQVAKASGAAPVVVIEPSERRRALLATWGIASIWDVDPAARREALASIMPPRGADLLIESSGRAGMSAEAIRLVRRGGTVILLSIVPELEPIDAVDLVLSEKIVRGSAAHMWDDDVAVAVSMLANGVIRVESMATLDVPLDRVESAFRALVEPGHEHIKVLIEVSRQA